MPRDINDFIDPVTRPLLHSDEHTRNTTYARYRRKARVQLSTKKKHYFTMALVALDVSGILADIFVALIACDKHEQNLRWVKDVREGLETASLVFSCLFLAELIATVWAFGFRYFSSWFHCIDAVVILASFVSDLLKQGLVRDITSLVILLRLFRFVKIVEELSVGASETMEELEKRIEQLEQENGELKSELRGHGGGNEQV